jgi:hypothetical protein
VLRTFSHRLAAALFLVCALDSGRARAATTHETQSWAAAFVQGRLDPTRDLTPGLWLDLHARRSDTATIGIVRPALGLYLDRSLSVWAGYAFIGTRFDDGQTRAEHRPWQQLQGVFPWAQHTFTIRTRTEQRWVDSGDDVGHRIRQLVRGQFALAPDWAAVLWDEAFFGLGQTDFGQPSGLDQNRVFLGVAFSPANRLRIEPGYLAIWSPRPEANIFVHALSANLFFWW